MDLLSVYYSLLTLTACLWIQLSSASDLTNTEFCASIVPESTPQLSSKNHDPLPSFPQRQAGFFRGGNSILGPSSSNTSADMNFLSFVNTGFSRTDNAGLYNLSTSLELRRSSISDTSKSDPVNLHLTGFWSETSGNLCMVGSGKGLDVRGKSLSLRVVLKLHFTNTPSITNSLITGTLESLSSIIDPNYFEPVSILAFSHMDYVYTISTKDMDFSEDDEHVVKRDSNRPISSLPGGGMCSMLSSTPNLFHLMDTSHSTFVGIDLKSFYWMSFDKFSCDEKNSRVRAMISFHNNIKFYRADSLNASLIAEGVWDADKNQLVFKACRFYNTSGFLYDVSVGDCTIMISWRFPAIWSINDSSAVLGRIRSIRPVKDLLYFSEIGFISNDVRMTGAEGLKYEYTQIEKVMNHCYTADKTVKTASVRTRYPNGNSDEMKFGMFINSSSSRFALGASLPLFINDLHYEDFSALWTLQSNLATDFQNISYRIGITLMPGETLPKGVASMFSKFNGLMTAWISAEGRYDSSTGNVCMIGCRRVSGDRSADCEILIKFQLPALGATSNASDGYIKGSIDSLRDMPDPLYFDHMDFTSSAFVTDFAKREVASLKTKMSVLLMSEIVASLLVLVQLRYVTKQPKVVPFVSIVMLLVLALRFFVTFIVSANVLARSHRQESLSSLTSWVKIEAKEIITVVTTFMGFVLLFRLVHLTWRSRRAKQTIEIEKNELWTAERKSLLSSILCYLIGALIVSAVKVVKEHETHHYFQPSILFQDLKLYFTILPGLLFLVPQVFFNTFSDEKCVQPLSHLFYIGTTFAAAMTRFVSGTDVFEESLDTYQKELMYFMTCLGLICSLIIFLQQKFGGHCIIVIIRRCKFTAGTASGEGNEENSIELTA